MATAGKILMFPVGNWTSGNNYGFLDIVYYGGSSYIAKTDITNSTTNPVADTTNWQILAHGYIADTLSGIDGIDTSGLLGTVGATVTGQALLDEIADRVATKLVLKTAISNQQVNDTTKVTGSALAYSMGQSIDTLNSNLNEYASGDLIVLSGLTGSIRYERSSRNFRIVIDAISGIALPAYTWVVIGGPIAAEFRSALGANISGFCVASENTLQCRINNDGNIEVFSSAPLTADYVLFGTASWIY